MAALINLNWRYWDPAKSSDVVGWDNPVTHPGTALWPYQQMSAAAAEFRDAGFVGAVLPPSTEGAAGAYSGGYDKLDDYSLSNTAFGDPIMLRQCVAALHANGHTVYGDIVLHQYDGGHNGVYATKRFPKTPQCFSNLAGGVAPDPVPDENGNYAFGDLAAYVHSQPPGYMHDGAIAAAQWLTATTGMDGFRVDDAKGTNAAVIYDLLHAPVLADKLAFFEYFDGSPDPVSNFVNGYMKRRGPVLDFATKFNIGNICNNQGRVWMGQLSHIGYCAQDPDMSLVFVESADTDTSIGQQTIWNKMLGYAIALTIPARKVSVYYRDWSDDANCYGLKHAGLNNLIWIHNNLAGGAFVPRLDTDPQVFVHERLGWGAQRGCLCGFNNDPNNRRTVTVDTSYPPHTRLHEFTGKYDTDIWTDSNGRATFTLAENINGMGFLVFGIWSHTENPPPVARRTKQSFFGASDLGIGPAMNGALTVGKVWAAEGSQLSCKLVVDRQDLPPGGAIFMSASGPDGAEVAFGPNDHAVVAASGFQTLTLTGAGLPAAGVPFELECTYLGAPV